MFFLKTHHSISQLSWRTKQQGGSTAQLLFIVLLLFIAAQVSFKLVPHYIEHHKIKSVLHTAIEDDELLVQASGEMLKNIYRRLSINQVDLPDTESLSVKTRDGMVSMTLDYEKRIPMIYNIEIVLVFRETYENRKP